MRAFGSSSDDSTHQSPSLLVAAPAEDKSDTIESPKSRGEAPAPSIVPVDNRGSRNPSHSKEVASPIEAPPTKDATLASEPTFPAPESKPEEADDAVTHPMHQPAFVDHSGDLQWTDLKLSPELMKGLQLKRFYCPSLIQEKTLPAIVRDRRGYVAQAVNGSGKTACFSLSMLAVSNPQIKAPQAICISHTRELCLQNMEVIKSLGCATSFSYGVLVPNCPMLPPPSGPQPQIWCGTPGKVSEAVTKRQLRLDLMQIFVLDEADVMVDPNNSYSKNILKVHSCMPKGIQTVCFSATYSKRVRQFAINLTRHCTNGAERIALEEEALKIDCIAQHYITCASHDAKKKALGELFRCMDTGQTVIFVNTRNDAVSVAEYIRKKGFTVSVLMGGRAGGDGMSVEERDAIVDQFRQGLAKVLIATDVLSRGIDVPAVTLVVNYDLPYGLANGEEAKGPAETYLHRIGRTGRFGQPGLAINFIVEGSNDMDGLHILENKYGMDITSITLDTEAIDATLKALRANIEAPEAPQGPTVEAPATTDPKAADDK